MPFRDSHRAVRLTMRLWQVSGMGLVKAVAGEESLLRIRVADRFDNTINPSGIFPYTFGLLLMPSRGGADKDVSGEHFVRHDSRPSIPPPCVGPPFHHHACVLRQHKRVK